jgi:translocation and assembly module TamB
MNSKRRQLLIITLIAGVFFLAGWLVTYPLPKIRSWILVNIEELSRKNLPVRVLPGAIEVRFYPLGITAHEVQISPNEDLKKFLDPSRIENIEVNISFWQLLQGRLRFNSIEINGGTLSTHLPKNNSKSAKPALDGLFATLAKIPLDRLQVNNFSLDLSMAQPRIQIQASQLDFSLEKARGGNLELDIQSASALVEDVSAHAQIRLGLDGNLAINPKDILITNLKLRRGNSFVTTYGSFHGHTESLKFSETDIELQGDLQLDSIGKWAKHAIPTLKNLPKLNGHITFNGSLHEVHNTPPEGKFSIQSSELKIDQYFLSKITTSGTYKNKVLQLPEVTIDHPAGVVNIHDFNLKGSEQNSDSFEISAKVASSSLQIHDLLKNIGVGTVPVWLDVNGELPCQGTIQPSAGLALSCSGRLSGKKLVVQSEMRAKTPIVEIPAFEALGEVSIDATKVSYKTNITMPNSKGHSSGVINYATGFKIDYDADSLAFKDIANLADLKLEGAARVKGSTEGDSDSAIFGMDLDASESWLEDYFLGDAKTHLNYKSGHLDFENLQGHIASSRYNGAVTVDFKKMAIGVQARAPFIDSKDLLTSFSRRVKLPFEVTGTGLAQIKISGPFEFSRLTYDLKASVYRGTVAGESFDQANFDVKSIDGEVKAERVLLTRGTGTIQLTGAGHPNGTIDTTIRGRQLRLEDSNFIGSTGFNIGGTVDFNMAMNGPVLSPETELHGTLTKTSISEQSLPDSKFNFKFTAKTIEGGGSFLGDIATADFILPLKPDAPFKLNAETKGWNFAPLFSALSGSPNRKDYEGHLNAKIQLNSNAGGFWNSNGWIDINDIYLTRGQLTLRSKEPLGFAFKNGRIRVRKFQLWGNNDVFFKLINGQNSDAKLDMQVNGKLDLGLISLITPFFEELRGILSFAFNLRSQGAADGPPTRVELLGSAYVDKGYLKFFDFPHPLEEIQADLLFNQNKIIVNSIKSDFAGGRAQAHGEIELKGYKNFPVNIAGTFDKVTLNVPEKVKTSGSGTIAILGSWFPFTLKGQYNIRDGLISKEFDSEEAESSGIRRSYFLPEFLLQASFVPISLNLDLNFEHGLAIKNELLDGKLIGSLNVQGNPTKPSLLGTIKTDVESKINFRDTSFDVTSANVQFTDPNEINPKIFITAQARVKEYDVNLQVQGTGKKRELILSSVPPLPEKEIISLLALGATDTQLATNITSQQQASQTGLQIGSGVLKNNPVSKVIREATGFDVQLAPSFDETNVAVQKVIASKQFTPKLGVTASRSFSKKSETEARVRYRLNERLSVVGSWKGTDYQEVTDQTTSQDKGLNNNIGLDLEYKVEFK